MKILKKLLWFVAAACVLSGCADDRMIYKPGSGSGNGGNGGGGGMGGTGRGGGKSQQQLF